MSLPSFIRVGREVRFGKKLVVVMEVSTDRKRVFVEHENGDCEWVPAELLSEDRV